MGTSGVYTMRRGERRRETLHYHQPHSKQKLALLTAALIALAGVAGLAIWGVIYFLMYVLAGVTR